MTKLDEAAKRQNEESKRKQRHEDKQADYNSPEEFRKTGGDVTPTQQVVPNQPNPEDNPDYAGTRYSGDDKK
jgi:hypothetical protein